MRDGVRVVRVSRACVDQVGSVGAAFLGRSANLSAGSSRPLSPCVRMGPDEPSVELEPGEGRGGGGQAQEDLAPAPPCVERVAPPDRHPSMMRTGPAAAAAAAVCSSLRQPPRRCRGECFCAFALNTRGRQKHTTRSRHSACAGPSRHRGPQRASIDHEPRGRAAGSLVALLARYAFALVTVQPRSRAVRGLLRSDLAPRAPQPLDVQSDPPLLRMPLSASHRVDSSAALIRS